MSEPLLKAIKIMGSRQKVIQELGITKQRLNSWLNNNVKITYEHAVMVEHLTCGQVKTSELVPEKVELLKKLKPPRNSLPSWLRLKQLPLASILWFEHLDEDKEGIKALALDIETKGLVQPIVIDEKANLILGKRRLQACSWLQHNRIDVYELSLSALVEVPNVGFQLQAYFTLSERVAIGIALEVVLGKRQGRRSDLQLLQNFAEVNNKSTVREKVALIIGLNNGESYRQAKKIVQYGIRPLIQALDEGKIRIYAAYEISTSSALKQHRLLNKYNQQAPKKTDSKKRNKK